MDVERVSGFQTGGAQIGRSENEGFSLRILVTAGAGGELEWPN